MHFPQLGTINRFRSADYNGAIVNATDAEGETPLDLAVFKSNNETAELLCKYSGKTSAELKAKGE